MSRIKDVVPKDDYRLEVLLDTYEGNYVNDKKQGQGTLVTSNGTKLVGNFSG